MIKKRSLPGFTAKQNFMMTAIYYTLLGGNYDQNLKASIYPQATESDKSMENKKTPINPLAGTWRLVEF